MRRLQEGITRDVPLLHRVTVRTALVLALALAGLTASGYALLAHELNEDVSGTLRDRSEGRAASVMRMNGTTTVGDAPRTEVFDEPSWVFEPDGTVLRGPEAPRDLARAAASLAGVSSVAKADGPDDIRLRADPVLGAGGEQIATVVVGASLKPYEETKSVVLLVLIVIDVCIVVLGALLARWAVGKAMRPGVADARDVARAAVDPAARAGERAGVRVTLDPEVRAANDGAGAAPNGHEHATLRVGAEAPLVVQALQPLLDNAIRHARSSVTVRLERNGAEALVHVVDDGEGIKATEAERVFAPGASGSGGAGLGLPLARRLARSCGGDVVAVACDGEPGDAGGHVVLRLSLVA